MQTILGLHATRNLRLPKFAPGEFVPRYHKYVLGADLRRQAYAVCRGVVVANGERDGRLAVLPAERPVAALHEVDQVRIAALSRLLRSLRRMRRPHVLVLERGYLKTGFKRRVFHSLWWPAPEAALTDQFTPIRS